jgi:hypothetical protein
MLRRVALVGTDVSVELSVSIIRVTRIGELGTTLAVTSNRRTLRRKIKCSLGPQRLESPCVTMSSLPIEENYLRFEVFTAVTMKNAVWLL